MRLQRVVLVLLGMMFLFAGRSSGGDVKTDYDRNANFAQYKTYSWERVQTRDPLMVDRIKSAVNGSLAVPRMPQADQHNGTVLRSPFAGCLTGRGGSAVPGDGRNLPRPGRTAIGPYVR
jgi:hypothetical protein